MNNFQIKHVQLDFKEYKISSKGTDINIDKKAFEVLKLLIDHKNEVVKCETFMHIVWGDKPSSQEVVPAAISRLRKLFKTAGIDEELIVTVHKVGYKFIPPEALQDNCTDYEINKKITQLKYLLAACMVLLILALSYIVFKGQPQNHNYNISQSTPADLKKLSDSNHTEIYILRHTEKIDNSEDPGLSTAGEKRALYWQKVLQYIDFDLILATNYKRNSETAEAIAQNFNTHIEFYHPMSFEVLEFISTVKGKKVLIIGHSNTIPDMANRILGESKYDPLSHKDYNKLILITISENGNTSNSTLHIEVPQ